MHAKFVYASSLMPLKKEINTHPCNLLNVYIYIYILFIYIYILYVCVFVCVYIVCLQGMTANLLLWQSQKEQDSQNFRDKVSHYKTLGALTQLFKVPNTLENNACAERYRFIALSNCLFLAFKIDVCIIYTYSYFICVYMIYIYIYII